VFEVVTLIELRTNGAVRPPIALAMTVLSNHVELASYNEPKFSSG
jgi:hypothetical protein